MRQEARGEEWSRFWQQIYDAVGKSIEMLQVDPERTTINDESLMDLIGKPKDILLQIKSALYEYQMKITDWLQAIRGLQPARRWKTR